MTNIRKTRLFRKWLLTYLLLTGISLLFIYSIHRVYDKTMREDISKLSNAYVEQVASLVEGEFKAIDRMVFSIGLISEIDSIMNMSTQRTPRDRYKIGNVLTDLNLFSTANRLIEDIDLYANNTKLLIGDGSTYYEEYIELYTDRNYGIGQDKLKDLMLEMNNQRVIRLKDWHNEDVIANNLVYIQSLPIQAREPSGGFIITINEKNLNSFAEVELFPNSKLMIFSEDNDLIYANDSELYNQQFNVDDMTQIDMKEIQLFGNSFIKETTTTAYKNWKYIILVPEAIYFERLIQTRYIILAITGAFFILNIFMAYYFTNRMYTPLKKIINNFANQEQFLEKSEYDFIESVIKENIEKRKKVDYDFQKQQDSLKSAFLVKVLKGQVSDYASLEEQLEYFDIYLSDDSFFIMLIQFHFNENSMQRSLAQFIINNVFDEILSNYVEAHSVEIDGMVAFLIHNDIQGISLDDIQEHFLKAMELTDNSFGIDSVIGISQVHSYIDQIVNAYQESLKAINHARIKQEKRIVYASEMSTHTDKYDFSIDLEYQLIHLIKLGDFNKSSSIINEIIHANCKKEMPKFSYLKFLIYDIFGAILKSIDGNGLNKLIEANDPMASLLQANSYKEMNQILVKVLRYACDYNIDTEKQQKKSTIREQIDQYIDKNYANLDLNVSKLGEIFNMTPAYLSKLYKQESGITILYALNKARVDASIKLMEETQLNIHEISAQVGYQYSNAFIRFFKSQTGITPGQYKSNLLNNRLNDEQ